MDASEKIAQEATKWIGTPWRHNQNCLGAGIDCVQLGRVCAEAAGIPQFVYKNYYRTPIKDSLVRVFEDHPNFREVSTIDRGNILIFRLGTLPHHVGIAIDHERMIHADGRAGVVEVNIGDWQRRLVKIYEAVV